MTTARVERGSGGLRAFVVTMLAFLPGGLFAAAPPLFVPSPGTPIATGSKPQSVATGDFNGDGKQDIAVANSQDSTLTILLGDGAGNFTPAAGSPISAGGTLPGVLIAKDFNKDNKIDLAVLYAVGGVQVLLGDGKGGFTPAPAGIAPVSSTGFMATGDFNGDLVPDLAISTGINKVTVYLGDGLGGFTGGNTFTTGFKPWGIATGDFNKDGKTDIVVANDQDGTITILLGDGTGGFTTTGSNPVSVLPGLLQTGNSFQSAIAVGDLYNHGPIDLITLSSGVNEVNVLKGDGLGSLTYQSEVTAYQNPDGVVISDFDGDGNQDVAVITSSTNSVDIFPGNGKGGLNYQTGPFFATGRNPSAIALADFNNDGHMDLVISNYNDNTLTVLLTTGPSLTPPLVPPTTPSAPVTPPLLSQTISFAVTDHLGSDAPFPLQATASSGLPVSFVIAGGPATVNGSMVTLTGLGTVTVNAVQAGNGRYASVSASQTFNVTLGLPSIASVVNAASLKAGVLPPNSYATVFGSNLAQVSRIGDATSTQTLGGTTLTIVDSTKQSFTPDLFFISFGQINFVVPSGVAAGPATLTVTNSMNKSVSATVTVGPVMPGLFSATGSGTGEAAGQALIVGGDGTQTVISTSFCTPFGCNLPVIPTSAGSKLYLILYGTGIQGRSSLAGVSITIGGTPATVLYAGPQGNFPALDQIDALVPASLAGAGVVDVQLTVDGIAANTLQIKLQ